MTAHQDGGTALAVPRVEMQGITKSYGALKVLRGVDLSVARGEVVGLVGDNGAGKSTLMKMLAGAVVPDRGRILVDGEELTGTGPRAARAHGIEMVYQDLALCNDVDVAGNLFLGREPYHRLTRRLDHERTAGGGLQGGGRRAATAARTDRPRRHPEVESVQH